MPEPAAVPEIEKVIYTVGNYIGLDADHIRRFAGCLDLLRLELVPAASPVAGVSEHEFVALLEELAPHMNEMSTEAYRRIAPKVHAVYEKLKRAQPSAEGDGWIAVERQELERVLRLLDKEENETGNVFTARLGMAIYALRRALEPAPVAKEGRES